jgi:hypothetical protein
MRSGRVPAVRIEFSVSRTRGGRFSAGQETANRSIELRGFAGYVVRQLPGKFSVAAAR